MAKQAETMRERARLEAKAAKIAREVAHMEAKQTKNSPLVRKKQKDSPNVRRDLWEEKVMGHIATPPPPSFFFSILFALYYSYQVLIRVDNFLLSMLQPGNGSSRIGVSTCNCNENKNIAKMIVSSFRTFLLHFFFSRSNFCCTCMYVFLIAISFFLVLLV
jgi:hypothetical protein